jgi:hypothetical protein
MSSLVWKQGDGWIQHDPPKGHPCYEERETRKCLTIQDSLHYYGGNGGC